MKYKWICASNNASALNSMIYFHPQTSIFLSYLSIPWESNYFTKITWSVHLSSVLATYDHLPRNPIRVYLLDLFLDEASNDRFAWHAHKFPPQCCTRLLLGFLFDKETKTPSGRVVIQYLVNFPRNIASRLSSRFPLRSRNEIHQWSNRSKDSTVP